VIINRVVRFEYPSVGSGYLVTDDLVLTCAHVLKNNKQCKLMLLPLLTTELQVYEAEVQWQSDVIDAAIVKIIPPLLPQILAYTRPQFAELRPNGTAINCYGRGFPEASSNDLFDDDYQFEGTAVCLGSKHEVSVRVCTKPAAAALWKGISGAAVFSFDRLIGFVRATDLRWGGAVLQAVSITAVLESLEARTLLLADQSSASIKVLGNDDRVLVRPEGRYSRRIALEKMILHKIEAARSAGSRLALVIRGPQGVGKTTLADDVCDLLSCSVRRVSEFADPSKLSIAEVVFVDGYLDDHNFTKTIDIGSITTQIFIFAVRTQSATERIARVLQPKGFFIDEIELGGLTEEEFIEAIGRGETSQTIVSPLFTLDEARRLYASIGGLPLVVQVLIQLESSPAATEDRLIWSDEIDVSAILQHWRQRVLAHDEDLKQVLFVFANVSRIGITEFGISRLLEWPLARVEKAAVMLYKRGFLARVADRDRALRCHSLIRQAFKANEAEYALVDELRARFVRGTLPKATEAPILAGSKVESILGDFKAESVAGNSKVESTERFLGATELLFSASEASPDGIVNPEVVFQEIDRLQQEFSIENCSSPNDESAFCRWLCEYIQQNANSMACNELIAISRIARSLSYANETLGNAFAIFWEMGRYTDVTIVSEGLLASVFHWKLIITADLSRFLERLRLAAERQPWGRMGSADIAAAAFAAAYAMIQQHSLGAALLGGHCIRGRGVAFSAGIEVLLLSLEGSKNYHGASALIHYHGHICRDIDPITTIYLRSAGIHCGTVGSIGLKISTNLNRHAVFGAWTGNKTFSRFVDHLCKCAALTSTKPRGEPSRACLQRRAK
jgi:Trypsin-like peptidase domain